MKRKIYKLVSNAKQGLFALALTVFSGTAYSQATYTYSYTGSVQTLNLLGGTYSITCWGADGGDGGTAPPLIGIGGKGGYSKGVFTVGAATTLYIYVGEKGQSNGNAGAAIVTAPGGFNGGGGGFSGSTSANYKGGGGGATHIATATGFLSALGSSTSAVVIVAGGGGGAGGAGSASPGYIGSGGNGGGTSGQDGVLGISQTTHNGKGGTQSAGGAGGVQGTSIGVAGSFGLGGDGGSVSGNSFPAGGGGGGWYGGGGGATQGGSGAGGSSYIGGVTSGTTIMFSQSGFVSNPDLIGNGWVIIKELCSITLNASTNPICLGASVTLTTSASNVNWSTGATGISTINVTPSVTTTYTLFGVGSNGTSTCSTNGGITVTVNPLPSIGAMINPTIVCVGGSSTLTPTGSALVYSMGTGTASQFVVTPSANTVATISGTNALGCVSTQTFAVNVNANQLSISSSTTTVCVGSQVNLTANGVTSYTWNTGSLFQNITVSPATATTYTAAGHDALNCLLSNVVTISTNPKPNVSAASDKITVCKGESVNLTAGGASTYTWNSGATGSVTTANPPIDLTYIYSVIGVDANGCRDTATVVVTAKKCTGINEVTSSLGIKVYPNPTKGEFMIESANNDVKNIEVTDVTGKVVLSQTLQTNVAINMTPFASGIYYVKVQSAEGVEVIKVVKE